ncbi:hypothetical protein [Streptococcus uberis]|uniref:hypothetical protein n=1 Tax=Streptococcus uberis TaxID=1349 RepID=UPI000DFFA827|nr:hypothetical protein [Streptococcus uberis]SUO89037.1 Uncharacterised protein [Streptococcus uberis]
METYFSIFVIIGGAFFVVGGFYLSIQLFKMIKMDAIGRGFKHPNFWALFASSGNNSSGLFLYLLGRRSYPIHLTSHQQELIIKSKKKFTIGLIFFVIGVIIIIWSLILLK